MKIYITNDTRTIKKISKLICNSTFFSIYKPMQNIGWRELYLIIKKDETKKKTDSYNLNNAINYIHEIFKKHHKIIKKYYINTLLIWKWLSMNVKYRDINYEYLKNL